MFIKNLKEIRLRNNISIPKLSALTGIHRRTIEDIEKRESCNTNIAIIFADFFNVTLDELCGRDIK